MNKFLSIPLALFLFASSALLFPVFAGEFDVLIDRTYSVGENEQLKVTETHTVTNNSENLLISDTNSETFQIPMIGNDQEALKRSVESAKVFVEGQQVNFEVIYKESFAEIKAKYQKDLRRGQSVLFLLDYTNFGLLESSGALIDIYAPGFVEDFKFSQGLTDVRYNTKFLLSDTLPETNFIIPSPTSSTVKDGYREIVFDQNALIGQTVWIQLGKVQYYQFEITQKAPATDSSNTGYLNEYRIILPRSIDEIEINQEVFYTKISPEPTQVIMDEEGNLIGYFKLPSNIDSEILVTGYAKVYSSQDTLSADTSGRLSDVTLDMVERYTGAADYWEVDAPQIQQVAMDLLGEELNVYKIIKDTYNHVVETIDYSEVKRFGINERQGALQTLNGGAAVCMEYSDLFLTLVRAQGIPARAAFGYGYDSRLPDNQQEAHQWVQVYMPGAEKWVSVDVTWGESGPALIGGDLNHFFTHTASVNPNEPAMVERVSYGSTTELNPPDFKFTAVPQIPDQIFTTSPRELLEKYPKIETVDVMGSLHTLYANVQNAFSSADPAARGQLLVIVGVGISVVACFVMILAILRGGKKNQDLVTPIAY